MDSTELSGLVLTHAQRNPGALIEQLATLCDQVVVVNDNRTGNLELAPAANEDCGVNVLERPFDTFPQQRNAGIEKALGDWVLSVDSDELISPELRREIGSLQPDDNTAVYNIPRSEVVKGKELRVAMLHSALHPRLFRASMRYAQVPTVHEEFEGFNYDTAGELHGELIHMHEVGIMGLAIKAVQYGRAWKSYSEGETYGLKRLLRTMPDFLLQRGYWRDGITGVGMAAVHLAYGLGTRLPASHK